MRRKVIQIMAWIQIVLSAALLVASPWWLQVEMDPERKWFLMAAYLVFGLAFLMDAVRDLVHCNTECPVYEGPQQSEDTAGTYFSAPDGTEVFCDVKIVSTGEVGCQYICFPDGLRLKVEEGRYTGWYLPDHQVMGGQ